MITVVSKVVGASTLGLFVSIAHADVARISDADIVTSEQKYSLGQEKLGPKSFFNKTCELPNGWKVPANAPMSYYFDNCQIPEYDMSRYCEDGCVTSEVHEKGTGHKNGILYININKSGTIRPTPNRDLDFWAPAGTQIVAPKTGQALYSGSRNSSDDNRVKMPISGGISAARRHNIGHLQSGIKDGDYIDKVTRGEAIPNARLGKTGQTGDFNHAALGEFKNNHNTVYPETHSVLPDLLACYAPQPDGSADKLLVGDNTLEYRFNDGGFVQAQAKGWEGMQVKKISPDYDNNGYPDYTTIEMHPPNTTFLTTPIACDNQITPHWWFDEQYLQTRGNDSKEGITRTIEDTN